MSVELDHLFILASVGAPEADCLVELGLIEGQPNHHPGQGTACRRFFFENAYLEFLWIADSAEVQGDNARPLQLYPRWSGRGLRSCPFGVVLRGDSRQSDAQFPSWEYRPPYLPPEMVLRVGTNADRVDEPLIVYIPFQGRPRRNALSPQKLAIFEIELRELTALRVFTPHRGEPSAAIKLAAMPTTFSFGAGSEFVAELGFDGELHAQRFDLRPSLPLILCW